MLPGAAQPDSTPLEPAERARAIGLAEAPIAAGLLQRGLPAELLPLFPASFVRSDRLHDEFICRLVLQVIREADVGEALREPGSAEEIAARAKLSAEHARVPLDWMLRFLAAHAGLEARPGPPSRYRAREALPAPDPGPVIEEQRRHDPSWMP